MVNRENINACVAKVHSDGLFYNNIASGSKSTWWVGSARSLVKDVDGDSSNVTVASRIMRDLRSLLQRKDPQRLHALLRYIDARTRGAGMLADETMVALRADLAYFLRRLDVHLCGSCSGDVGSDV